MQPDFPHLSGAMRFSDGSCRFRVWAPLKNEMILHLLHPDRMLPMSRDGEGYFTLTLPDLTAETTYFFRPNDTADIPDPASYYQPYSVHGPSQVVDHYSFCWEDEEWKGIPFKELIIYEIHVGTFTEEGTFDAIIPRLEEFCELGINAIEIMPVSQFPGTRNWGYDGVFPYAVQNSYGGPDGLKRLVNACHQKGIAVLLDVVYNHLGPEGNYLAHYAPYFTSRYVTPWGEAINYDGEWSDGVREYFSNNALFWFAYYHLDGLRLDSTHVIFDHSAVHFLTFMNSKVEAFQELAGRPLHMVAESDLNAVRTIHPKIVGGYGFRAQWLDDFHHALFTLIYPQGKERYIDFGRIEQLAKAYTDGYVHSGEYVTFRKRKHGESSAGIPGDKFIVFNQNHDQVGNRPAGDRLSALVDCERLKLASAALMLAPYIPLLFMGEEYADSTPFYYFVSHSDPALIAAIRKGRKEEFKDFNTAGESPDPQDEQTFRLSKLCWNKRDQGLHAVMRDWIKTLIQLRKTIPAFRNFHKDNIQVHCIAPSALVMWRQEEGGIFRSIAILNFSPSRDRRAHAI